MKGKCLLCDSSLDVLSPLMHFDNMPSSAQNIPSVNEVSKDKGISLDLLQCKCCGLVQFDCEPVDYYRKVIRAGGGSSTMLNLRHEEYNRLLSTFPLKGKKIIEVGCGKGEFLKCWSNFDVHAVGIEYNEDLVRLANEYGLEVYNAYAEEPDTKLPNGPYDAFVQFNFMEHQPYPNKMLQCIYNNLTENGVGMVTVPSLEYIQQYDGYYELIRDHIAYYSEDTFRLLFEKNGFEVVSLRTVNRDTHEIIIKKRGRMDVSQWRSNFDALKSELHSYFDSYISIGKKVAVWGASHQAFTLIPSLELSNKVSYIIDSASFKQGRYAPASHVPIFSPFHYFDEKVDSILIVAPGYTNEIAEIIRKELNNDIDIRTLRSNHLEII